MWSFKYFHNYKNFYNPEPTIRYHYLLNILLISKVSNNFLPILGCSEIPKHISTQTITRPKNHYDYTTLITVGVAIAITLGILASAVG